MRPRRRGKSNKVQGHGKRLMELMMTFKSLTRKELLTYLSGKDIPPAQIDTLVHRLVNRGILRANPVTYSLAVPEEDVIAKENIKKDLFL